MCSPPSPLRSVTARTAAPVSPCRSPPIDSDRRKSQTRAILARPDQAVPAPTGPTGRTTTPVFGYPVSAGATPVVTSLRSPLRPFPFGPNDDRGIFKTIDGGKTWQKDLTTKVVVESDDLGR